MNANLKDGSHEGCENNRSIGGEYEDDSPEACEIIVTTHSNVSMREDEMYVIMYDLYQGDDFEESEFGSNNALEDSINDDLYDEGEDVDGRNGWEDDMDSSREVIEILTVKRLLLKKILKRALNYGQEEG